MNNTTIVISCAGEGRRLGIGTTKALVDINGKPLIICQLEQLKDQDDIRVVVGYHAEDVINVVKRFREDITFVYNYCYETTGTADSFSKGMKGAREFVVSLDGDLLVNPDDMKSFLAFDGECVCGCDPTTDNPVLMTINKDRVVEFSREKGQLEWTGLAKLKTSRVTAGNKHVYMMIEPLMPIKVMKIRSKEIDTPNDYQNALKWVKNGYEDL